MKIFQSLGAFIIFLVVVAFARTPEFFETSQHAWLLVVMLITITLMGIVTIIRSRKEISSEKLFIFGAMFLLSGSVVFFFFPDYLYAGLSLKLSIWHKISFYTLPSICVEGGIATLLLSFLNKSGVVVGAREKVLVVGFLVYAVTAISISFMTVFGIISVDHHVMISRIIIPVILILSLVRFLKK